MIFLGGAGSYVEHTYNWVKDHYDGTRPLHQTAMLIAIVFSKILPRIFNHTKSTNPSQGMTVTQVVRNAPWTTTTSDNRKGFTFPGPFVIMMSTFIIAIYEEQSPLRRYMAANGNSMGSKWCRKHSE